MLETTLDVVLFILALILVVLVLLQGGKAEGASGAITGGNMRLFSNIKERGAEKRVSQITMTIGILFFLTIIWINFLKK